MNEIRGFLHRKGRKIVNGAGEEVILKGWGLGNWLLPEGYMWLAGGNKRFDRPRRIEQALEELTGKAYAENFWKQFRDNYITHEDIRYIKELGYNSVRIPFNWRILMEEDEGIIWREEGFLLLDRCLDWCEAEGMYAFLDLHGAPGGQTGSNIDDSIDDIPRLYTEKDKREKCLALWEKIALRYCDRPVVGGYDLLNEPVRPPENGRDFDELIPLLSEFYRELAARIRSVDKNHMLTIEGAHWATDLRIFTERVDENMVLHFHRYAEKPEWKCLKAYADKAEELDVPLWLGESGENMNEWYAALYPLAVSAGCGYNLWPFKKMECTNSPCSIRKPEDYDQVLGYMNGGPHPGYEKSRRIFDEYLENIRLENCDLHSEVTNHVFRRVPFSMMAVDFDEFPGEGISFSGRAPGLGKDPVTDAMQDLAADYRRGSGMRLAASEAGEKRFVFDCQWDRFSLLLGPGEFAEYTIENTEAFTVVLLVHVEEETHLQLSAGSTRKDIFLKKGDEQAAARLEPKGGSSEKISIRITVETGEAEIKKLEFTAREPVPAAAAVL